MDKYKYKYIIVLMFNDGIKYGLKVVLFNVIVRCITFLTAMSSSCVQNDNAE